MEMSVYREEPAITISNQGSGGSCGQQPEEKILEIFYSDLKDSRVGDVFAIDDSLGCHDLISTETLTVVYQEETSGVACLRRVHYESYNWEEAPEDRLELMWFEYH